MEGREEQRSVMMRRNREGTLMSQWLSTKLHHISERARWNPTYQFKTLAHLITEETLEWAYRQLRTDAAAGADEITAQEYGKNLTANLKELHTRLRERRYRAQPLRRVYIAKEDGKKRPLSIPVLEDKIVQKAVTMILERIYENDFLTCSYGYRPKRNARDAILAIQKKITLGEVSYVLEADIRDYFGSIVHRQLMEWLRKRIEDGDILRLIGKWLKVGVIEDGRLLLSENGTYQGSVISPLLANIYLHEVLDIWVERTVKPRMRGEITLVRYADDFVACFQYLEDAEKFLQVLPKRFGKYGLELHPEKTRLIEFGRSAWGRSKRDGTKLGTFNFLGFTFYCSESREGRFTVKSKTMSKRLRRGLKRVANWCRVNRHLAVEKQNSYLRAVLLGHYQYYGLRANYRCLLQFYRGSIRLWKKWLGYRHRSGAVPWVKMNRILTRYPLPRPRITQGQRWNQLLLAGEFT